MKVSNYMENEFWEYLERLIAITGVVIDRPKGSKHPRLPSLIYPLDYGFLRDTRTIDGSEIDVWVGSDPDNKLKEIICTVDIFKKDVEIKLLIGCTKDELEDIVNFHNSASIKGLIIRR